MTTRPRDRPVGAGGARDPRWPEDLPRPLSLRHPRHPAVSTEGWAALCLCGRIQTFSIHEGCLQPGAFHPRHAFRRSFPRAASRPASVAGCFARFETPSPRNRGYVTTRGPVMGLPSSTTLAPGLLDLRRPPPPGPQRLGGFCDLKARTRVPRPSTWRVLGTTRDARRKRASNDIILSTSHPQRRAPSLHRAFQPIPTSFPQPRSGDAPFADGVQTRYDPH